MNNTFKHLLISLLVGGLVAVLVGAFLLTISLDMRWMAVFAITLAFVGSYWLNRKWSGNDLIGSLIFTLPFAIFFYLVIRPDLPSLWFTIPTFYLSALLGVKSTLQKERRPVFMGASAALSLAMVFIIPQFVGGDLTQTTNETGIEFELEDHQGDLIKSVDLKGKAIVLDFYGTWCKPCIAELPELAKVKAHFENSGQVKFLIVNSDQGGDDLEKAKRFAKRFDFGFTYTYDYDRKVYKQLGLGGAGVPSLVMLDRDGNIRLRHVGYNKSETDFVENMIEHLNDILAD